MKELPCLPLEVLLAEIPSDAPESAAKPQALVVDDDPVFLATTTEILEVNHYQVVASSDARRALLHLEETAFDCMVTDLYMPHESGLWLVEHALAVRPDLAVVLMSGGSKRDLDRSSPDWLFVAKPFSSTELLEAVASAMATRRAGVAAGR
ncbi:MAG: response regulator [Acidobacteriota bacterium]